MLSLPFEWDACQMPNNIMDSGFQSFRQQVMPVCEKKKVGIIGMKGVGGDALMVSKGAVTLEECYQYFLSQPVSVQVVGLSSLDDLNRALQMARTFKPMAPTELTAIQKRIKEVMGDGRYELFKSSKKYDSAYHRQQHGFETQGV
jgi:uncharacterized protein